MNRFIILSLLLFCIKYGKASDTRFGVGLIGGYKYSFLNGYNNTLKESDLPSIHHAFPLGLNLRLFTNVALLELAAFYLDFGAKNSGKQISGGSVDYYVDSEYHLQEIPIIFSMLFAMPSSADNYWWYLKAGPGVSLIFGHYRIRTAFDAEKLKEKEYLSGTIPFRAILSFQVGAGFEWFIIKGLGLNPEINVNYVDAYHINTDGELVFSTMIGLSVKLGLNYYF